MFSGIVEELGRLVKIQRRSNLIYLEIKTDLVCQDIKIGDSISVNGVCLTVISLKDNTIGFQVMQETAKITNLGILKINDQLNLERSLKLGDRISGHLVQGHIDCLGIIRRKTFVNNNLCFEIAVPQSFIKYIVPKGSVAVDGISLTVVEKKANIFSVYIIPHTLKNTTLGFRRPSDKVNIEFDLLIKANLSK